jgi:type I restriction enzyme R subunit
LFKKQKTGPNLSLLSLLKANKTASIDVDLKEAGWFNLNQGRELEYPVKGMPYSR